MSSPPTIALPGRLGNPDLKLYQDPRAHPRIVEALSLLGADGRRPSPFERKSAAELASHAFIGASHAMAMQIYDALPLALASDATEPAVTETVRTFPSGAQDPQPRNLYIYRRADLPSGAPAVVYLHGGGMVTGDTANRVHLRWLRSLAAAGVVAVAVDFRNAWSADGPRPFPAGLDDCVAGVRWVDAHRAELGIGGTLVLQGESGGANLAFATMLRARREGWLSAIAGVYGVVPYISNGYGWDEARKLRELPSLVENEGYFLACRPMAGMAEYYSPNDATNPLAWPYYVEVEELKGMPPHRLTMDELDPLRDEGMAYYRKLLKAGVEVVADVNLGTVHASGLIFRQLLPEYYNGLVTAIADFAKKL